MSDKAEHRQQQQAQGGGDFGQVPLPLISEIARRALKKIIAEGRPAVPPIFEKSFFNPSNFMKIFDLSIRYA